jgi:RNA polymerase sigma factor for flagellar operon FliA
VNPSDQYQPKELRLQNRKPDRRADELVGRYLPLVRFVAEKIYRRLPPGIDLESLIHSGVVGLLEALDRFDPNRGVEFEAFARYRIQGEVMQCLRSHDWVSRSLRSWGRKMESARAKLAGQLIREPKAEEMAEELKIPLDSYFRLDQQVNDATLLSIEDLSTTSEPAWERTQERSSTDSLWDPLSFVERKDLVEKLAAAVERLPERERLAITLYYHQELTLREISEIFDLSEGRVSQIFAKAVQRLREALGISVRRKSKSVPKRSTDVREELEQSHQPAASPIVQSRWKRRRIYVCFPYRQTIREKQVAYE